MLKVRLSAACYDVVAVSSAEALEAALDRAIPDMVILGGGCPAASSLRICRELSGDGRLREVPVLMLIAPERRLEALQAGAAATLDPEVDDQMLMARIRTILRDADAPRETPRDPHRSPFGAPMGMAESAAGFAHAERAVVVLIADHPARAMRWRHLLSERMSCRFEIRDPDEALAAAGTGRTADLYVISADLRGAGDGLRLLSELRARHGSRDAGFVIATGPAREDLSAIALDLGAGEVMPDTLASPAAAQAAAMSLQLLLSRKSRSDQRRAEMQRHKLWAMTDALTGLHNRRYALPRLTEIAGEALALRRGFAVLAIDLDHFKAVNDCHGHSAGDAVLSDIAQRLRETAGPDSMTARMGGEEFLAVLSDCTPVRATRIAEALRRSVQARPVRLPAVSGGGAIRVTASVGVALVPPGQEGPPDQTARLALERADRALRAAKAAGRNQVVCSRSERAA